MFENDNKIMSLIVEKSNDLIYLADMEDYTLYFLNKKGMEITGTAGTEQWLGKPCYQVLYKRESPCPFCRNSLLKKDAFYDWDFYNMALKKHFLKRGIIVDYKGRTARMEYAIDITDMKEIEGRLKKELQVNKVLTDCALALNQESGEGDELIHSFMDKIIKYYNAGRVFIHEIDNEGEWVKNTYEICREGVEPQINKTQDFPMSTAFNWVEEFERGSVYRLNKWDEIKDESSEKYRILSEKGAESLMAVPLILEEKLIGFLGVDNPQENVDIETLLKSASEFIVNDIRKRQIRQEVQQNGCQDELTGLGNRKKYHQVITRLNQDNRKDFGIVSVDIDCLRNTNNAFSYAWGDHLLCYVAETLKNYMGEYVYRIGDDEFVAFGLDIGKEDFKNKIKDLCERSKWDEQLQISIGSSWYDGESDIDYQISVANEKMYINKAKNYKRGSSEDGIIDKYRVVMADRLQKDIESGQFVVFLQPQINLKTDEIAGAEALVRRIDFKGNVIYPNSFIGKYESDEIISYVDFFVLEQVCRTLKSWKEAERKCIGIAVNFSRITLMEDGVVGKMRAVCAKYAIAPDWITVEVTESIGMMERDTLRNLLADIKKAGFRISLDDFGSRYSDLALLSLADFDELKLDRSLIDKLEQRGKSRTIAEYVLRMNMELGSTHSVAEGIETVTQREILKSFGCEFGQGFLFDKAIAIKEFETKYMNGQKEGYR